MKTGAFLKPITLIVCFSVFYFLNACDAKMSIELREIMNFRAYAIQEDSTNYEDVILSQFDAEELKLNLPSLHFMSSDRTIKRSTVLLDSKEELEKIFKNLGEINLQNFKVLESPSEYVKEIKHATYSSVYEKKRVSVSVRANSSAMSFTVWRVTTTIHNNYESSRILPYSPMEAYNEKFFEPTTRYFIGDIFVYEKE